MSAGKQHDPVTARKKVIANASLLRILLLPLIFLLRLIIRLTRRCGLESILFRLIFRVVSRNINNRMEKAFTGYEPKANDVFVCSYFKAGTNWTMQIAYQIANRGAGEYQNIHDVIPWPDAPIKALAVPLSETSEKNSITGLRVIKTHSLAYSMPYSRDAKYICVVRDPKDVFVSSYHYVRSVVLGNLMPTVATWLDIFLSKVAMHDQWADFLCGYWKWRDRPNVLFLTYEEMKDDLAGTIRRIADLTGVSLTPEESDRICHASSYAHMKSIGDKFYPGRITPFSLKSGQMIRSGEKGKSDELLSIYQQKRIDDYCRRALQRLGCDFPYDTHYASYGMQE
jgi:hypothetical protein